MSSSEARSDSTAEHDPEGENRRRSERVKQNEEGKKRAREGEEREQQQREAEAKKRKQEKASRDVDEDMIPVDEDGKPYDKKVLDAVLDMSSVGDLKELVKYARPLACFEAGGTVRVYDKMERGVSYKLECEPNRDFDEGFKPALSPQQMLEAGVFEGRYLNDCVLEFPREWYEAALAKKKLSVGRPNKALNRFKIKSRQSLTHWQEKGWVPANDPRGWFQWYCRYWLGRRTDDDAKQIGRWKNFARHSGQVKNNCAKGDLECRPKQRQALLQWAWDAFI